MALKASETKLVASLGSSSFNNAGLMHEACVLAIRKGYSNAEDKGEFGQAICNAVTVSNRIECARFLRKWGLNVTIEGKAVTIGAPRDPKQQAKHIIACANDIGFFQLVDAHVKPKSDRKAPTGTVLEQANEAITKLINRMKGDKLNPLGPEVAGAINNMLTQKTVELEVTQVSTFVTKEGHVYEIDSAEEEAMLNWLLGRTNAKAQLTMVGEMLKAA